MESQEEQESECKQRVFSPGVERKLTDLEKRAIALEKEFDKITKRTAEIETWTKQYEAKVIEERRLLGLLHTLVRPGDKRTKTLMNHLSVFFNDVLTRMAIRGIHCNKSLNYLHRHLSEEKVSSTFDMVMTEMNFGKDEIRDIKHIIQLIHPRIKPTPKLAGAYELHCSESDPSFAQQEINLFLQIRNEIDEPMRNVLNKIVATCYCEEQKSRGDNLEEENR